MIKITITTSTESFNCLDKVRLKKSNIKLYALFIIIVSTAALILNWQFAGGIGVGLLFGLGKLYRVGPSFFENTDSSSPSTPTDTETEL
jgi:hypothetical protein